MKLSFQNIQKDFSGLRVIQDFSRDIDDGELVALVGPSGCGKSTLLHIAAGLEKPSQGAILADGAPVQGPHPERTLMFQENALYPWLTLEQNVALALELALAFVDLALGADLPVSEVRRPDRGAEGFVERAAEEEVMALALQKEL